MIISNNWVSRLKNLTVALFQRAFRVLLYYITDWWEISDEMFEDGLNFILKLYKILNKIKRFLFAK